MLEFVRVRDTFKGLITATDRTVFTTVKIGLNSEGQTVVMVEHDDQSYFDSWVHRVGGMVVGGWKNKVRSAVEFDVGEDRDRIADIAKMANFCFVALAEIFDQLTTDQKNAIDTKVKESLEDLLSTRSSTPNLFNIDIPETYLETTQKLIDRETTVKNFMENIPSDVP